MALADDLVRDAVRFLLDRGQGGPELLAYEDDEGWRDVNSAEINAYIKERVGQEVSAKDFRTWHGTVIAAVVLAVENERARTVAARKRAVAAAMREVSGYFGNTPAVARKSYVDPRVVDLFNDGITIPPTLASEDQTCPTASPTAGSSRPYSTCWIRRSPDDPGDLSPHQGHPRCPPGRRSA